jgi:Raf kinase inhibitor-like YbhB/YbcL family protein
MRLTSPNFKDGEPIPGDCAFAVPDPEDRVSLAENRNPALEWEDVPEGTRSFALLCIDTDAPTVADDVNREGREVPADLPRADFSHWVLVDVPGEVRSIDEAAFCQGVTPRGKAGRQDGPREGLNDYTSWFQGDSDMEGVYKGYDGPGPPWNDARVHRYVFTLYALDIDSVPVSGDFTAEDVEEAISGHVLAEASLTGTYTLNPALT